MQVKEEKIEIVKSRTYTLDQHDVETVDAFCSTIMNDHTTMTCISAAKGLARMFSEKKDCQGTQQQGPLQKEKTYTVTITEVKKPAAIVFGKGRTWCHVTHAQKNAIMDILQPWCKYHVEEDR